MTDMRRVKSMFNLRPDLIKNVVESLEKDGCNLGNVTAACGWSDPTGNRYEAYQSFFTYFSCVILKVPHFPTSLAFSTTSSNSRIKFKLRNLFETSFQSCFSAIKL